MWTTVAAMILFVRQIMSNAPHAFLIAHCVQVLVDQEVAKRRQTGELDGITDVAGTAVRAAAPPRGACCAMRRLEARRQCCTRCTLSAACTVKLG